VKNPCCAGRGSGRMLYVCIQCLCMGLCIYTCPGVHAVCVRALYVCVSCVSTRTGMCTRCECARCMVCIGDYLCLSLCLQCVRAVWVCIGAYLCVCWLRIRVSGSSVRAYACDCWLRMCVSL
jgi:hypothetical protein